VQNRSNKKIRTQTLVYNDAQTLHLDRRMLFSGTELVTGTAQDRTAQYNGWKKDSTGWRYKTAKGKWLSGGWKTIGGKTYYFTIRGYRHEGWLTKSGRKYFMSRIGIRQTGW
jgi:glucan-binding YG repeat protein